MNIVYVSCKTPTEAKKIAKSLVEKRLAVCTNIIPKVYSIYRWKGTVEEENEAVLIIKTDDFLLQEVTNQIKKLHSYKMPEIISWKADTTDEIKHWLKDELRRRF